MATTRFVTLDEALAGKLAGLAPQSKVSMGAALDEALGKRRPRSPKQKAQAKGQRWEQQARQALEALGCRVESAPKVLVWVPSWTWPKSPELRAEAARLGERPKLEPRSRRHDFFGIWDLISVEPSGLIRCVQVTDPHNLPARRTKILKSGWPAREDDLLMVYIGRARFALYHGPAFEERTGELHAPPKKKASH